MASQNKAYTYYSNKFLFYIILFVSFVVAMKINPWITEQVPIYLGQYIQSPWAYPYIGYLLTFLAAMYIIPEIGFLIYKSMSDK